MGAEAQHEGLAPAMPVLYAERWRAAAAHQALTHDDVLVMPLGHLLPPLAYRTLDVLWRVLITTARASASQKREEEIVDQHW
jgi:hypothetical protein